jgi:hypothetical protein
MMPPQAAFMATSDVLRQLGEKLKDYDYASGDSIVLLGDTTLVACAVALLAKRHGKFTTLRWDRNLGRYTRVVVSV